MEHWLAVGFNQVRDVLSKDVEYQRLMQECDVARKRYDAIVAKLTEEERLVIEDYNAICEELEYQWTHTAYRCGRNSKTLSL